MNQTATRGPIARFFIGIWDAMNFTRRLILNLIFFALLWMVLVVLFGGDRVKPTLERSTLVIAPEGRLVEQYSSDPLLRGLSQALGDTRTQEVQLRDLLRAIQSAKEDPRIERVFLRVDRLQTSGIASLREVAAALADLRASGKQIIAFGENYEQSQYLLAAQANEVYLDPMGGLVLEGLGRYRQYYKKGLDKLGVDVHLFKVGQYKSAAEPYVLDGASPQSKEADLFWMNDVWQRYLGDVAKARKLTPEQLASDIDNFTARLQAAQGDTAQLALQQKLVDGLKTQEQVETLLAERGVADTDADGGFRQMSMSGYLTRLDSALAAVDERPQVAVVVAEGAISGGEQPPGNIGGESTAAMLRATRDDEKVKAVVLRVSSPGGEVFASEQIRREVVALKAAGKPVVVSMGDYAASGGYWISMNADRIFADPSTITGSIGIFGVFPTIPRTLEKVGITTDGVGTTRFAGAFDITRPLNPEVGTIIQSIIDKGYRDFTGRVAQARSKSVEEVDAIAQGRVWSGAQGKERGLVDEFGGTQDAILDAAKRAKLGAADTYRVRYVEQSATPFERFFGGFAESLAGRALLRETGVARGVLANILPQTDRDLRFLQAALKLAPGQNAKALAYCFCEF